MASTEDQAPALSAEEAAPSKRFCDVSRGTKEKVIPDARRLRKTQSCLGGAMDRGNGRLLKRFREGISLGIITYTSTKVDHLCIDPYNCLGTIYLNVPNFVLLAKSS